MFWLRISVNYVNSKLMIRKQRKLYSKMYITLSTESLFIKLILIMDMLMVFDASEGSRKPPLLQYTI